MSRRVLKMLKQLRVFCVMFGFVASSCFAQTQTSTIAPNELIADLSTEMLNLLKSDEALRAGNTDRIMEIIDAKLLPHLDFRRMTAMAVGPKWREATDEQKDAIEHEFEMMLIRTYSGALDQVSKDVTITMLPFRGAADDTDALVRSEVRTSPNATPVELSYRLRLGANGWMVYNVNVAGVWMVENYRSQFQPILNKSGIDGLIKALQEQGATIATK